MTPRRNLHVLALLIEFSPFLTTTLGVKSCEKSIAPTPGAWKIMVELLLGKNRVIFEKIIKFSTFSKKFFLKDQGKTDGLEMFLVEK